MKREIELKGRLRSLEALGEAVSAMKSLSAHHLREARNSVQPARRYRDGVAQILEWAGATLTAGDGGAGLLVIGAELGLCGGYNAHLIELGARHRAELDHGPTFCVGHRAAILLKRRDVDVDRVYGGPTSVRGITALLLKLAEDMLTAYATERLSSFDIVSSRFAGVGKASPASIRLLPVEPEESDVTTRPRYVEPDHFVSVAVREYLYITLFDLLLDALASEHGARLVATQSAEKWLDERTERLRRHLMAIRREASTQEMIEIAAGARALKGSGSAAL
jgi:F-type H+-transporting ATPase subunit gamma